MAAGHAKGVELWETWEWNNHDFSLVTFTVHPADVCRVLVTTPSSNTMIAPGLHSSFRRRQYSILFAANIEAVSGAIPLFWIVMVILKICPQKNNKSPGGWPGQTSLVLRLLRAVERAGLGVIRPELLKVGLRSQGADLRALLWPPRGSHNGFLPPVAAIEARSFRKHRR